MKVIRDNFNVVLQRSRVSIVQKILIRGYSWSDTESLKEFLEQVLTAVLNDQSELKKLEVEGSDKVDSLNPELLSQAVVKLEECRLVIRLSTAQIVSTLTAIVQTNNLKLKILDFRKKDDFDRKYISYSEIPPEVLTAAILKLEKTNILYQAFEVNMSSKPPISFFMKMVNCSVINMKRLNLNLNSEHSSLPPMLFGDALIRIETLRLTVGYRQDYEANIRDNKVSILFQKIAGKCKRGERRLRELELEYIKISHISPEIISKATLKLNKLCAIKCLLTTEQLTAIFSRLATVDHHRLRILSIVDTNLKSIPTETLAAGISGLKVLDLTDSWLTTEQLTGIFTRLSEENSKLRTLVYNRDNALSSVPVETLAKGIISLKEVHIRSKVSDSSELTTEQLTAIFTTLSTFKEHKLRILNVCGADLRLVPTEILVDAISGLEVVGLLKYAGFSRRLLTEEQYNGMYGMVADRKCPRLRKIYLGTLWNTLGGSQDLKKRAGLNKYVEIIPEVLEYKSVSFFDYGECFFK